METYLVKFWLQNHSGFLEQQSEIVKAKSKNHHKWVEDFIMKNHGWFLLLALTISLCCSKNPEGFCNQNLTK